MAAGGIHFYEVRHLPSCNTTGQCRHCCIDWYDGETSRARTSPGVTLYALRDCERWVRDESFVVLCPDPAPSWGKMIDISMVRGRGLGTTARVVVTLICIKRPKFPKVTHGKELCKPYLEWLMGRIYAKHATSHWSWGGIMQVLICINPHNMWLVHCFKGRINFMQNAKK